MAGATAFVGKIDDCHSLVSQNQVTKLMKKLKKDEKKPKIKVVDKVDSASERTSIFSGRTQNSQLMSVASEVSVGGSYKSFQSNSQYSSVSEVKKFGDNINMKSQSSFSSSQNSTQLGRFSSNQRNVNQVSDKYPNYPNTEARKTASLSNYGCKTYTTPTEHKLSETSESALAKKPPPPPSALLGLMKGNDSLKSTTGIILRLRIKADWTPGGMKFLTKMIKSY